jgi:hypothetical protein
LLNEKQRFLFDFIAPLRYTASMKFHFKIDNKETGKQCAAISTGLVLGALAQLLLEPEKIRPLFLMMTILGALGWYVAAQIFFTREVTNGKKNGESQNDAD